MEFICLSFFQVLGVALAVFLFYLLFGRTYVLQPQQHINIIKPFSLEILFSGLIVFSYLHGKRFSKHPESNPAVMVGIAILVSVLTTASISGGCFNPALGLGPVIPELLYKSGYNIHHIWIYVWGPIIGSVLAFIADKILTSPGNE